MLPHRHTLLCLIALVALAGCKTKPVPTTPAPAPSIGANHGGSRGKQTAPRATPKDSAPANTAEAASNQRPSTDTPTGTTSPTIPSIASKPQPSPAPTRSAARLTLSESPLPATALKTSPRPVSLSGLITDTPTSTPAPARLSVGIPASSLADAPPARTPPQPIDLLSRLSTSPAATDPAASPAPVSLSLATPPISTARFDQPLTVSLPATPNVIWQSNSAPAAPALFNWVPPVTAPPPSDSSATREDRDTLHRKVYQFLLGQP